jgi:hypothetical protein
MRLPDLVAQQAAVQHPAIAFADPQLRAATAATGLLAAAPGGVAPGTFALTCQPWCRAQQWATDAAT